MIFSVVRRHLYRPQKTLGIVAFSITPPLFLRDTCLNIMFCDVMCNAILFKKLENLLNYNPNDFENPPQYNPDKFSL